MISTGISRHAGVRFETARDKAIRKSQERAYYSQKFIEVNGEFIALAKPKAKKAPAKKKKTYLETLEYRLNAALKNIEKYRAAGEALLLEYSEKNARELTEKINAVKKIRRIA